MDFSPSRSEADYHGNSPMGGQGASRRLARKISGSKKFKLEMCRYIMDGLECPFGSYCTFAHNSSELQLTTLREREEAGLLDVGTFRVRPCFDYVATGSCPFGHRCSAIHDVWVSGRNSAWLPRCEQQNALPTNVHIDWSNKMISSIVHYGTGFGKLTKRAFSSFVAFCDLVCCDDLRPKRLPFTAVAKPNQGPGQCTTHVLSKFQRLKIVLTMYPKRSAILKYQPTHLVFGHVCMIVQARAFDGSNGTVRELLLRNNDPEDELKRHESDHSNAGVYDERNPDHIIAREIAFGPSLREGDPPLAIWFNTPNDQIVPCTFLDQIRYNKAKRRKRTSKKKPEKRTNSPRTVAVYHPSPYDIQDEDIEMASFMFGSGDESFHRHHTQIEAPFHVHYYLNDEKLHDLVVDVMQFEMKTMIAGGVRDAFKDISMQKRFNSMKAYFEMNQWPLSSDREMVNEDTPVPDAEGVYCVPVRNERRCNQWNSFIRNLSLLKTTKRNEAENQGEKGTRHPIHHFQHTRVEDEEELPPKDKKVRRLRVFMDMSPRSSNTCDGKGSKGSSAPPLITSQHRALKLLHKPQHIFDDGFEKAWEAVKNAYDGI